MSEVFPLTPSQMSRFAAELRKRERFAAVFLWPEYARGLKGIHAHSEVARISLRHEELIDLKLSATSDCEDRVMALLIDRAADLMPVGLPGCFLVLCGEARVEISRNIATGMEEFGLVFSYLLLRSA